MIDPWVTSNPKTPPPHKNLDALCHVNLILVSRGHSDHLADVAGLAK